MADKVQNRGPGGPPQASGQGPERCAKCGAPLAADQRYCMQCGVRRGQPRIDFTAFWKRSSSGASATAGASAPASPGGRAGVASRKLSSLLAAVMLAGGIATGAAIGPVTGGGTGSAFAGVIRALLTAGALGLPGARTQAPPAAAPPATAPPPSQAASSAPSIVENPLAALPASGRLKARLRALRAKLRAEREAAEAAATSAPAPESSLASPNVAAGGPGELLTTSHSTGGAGGHDRASRPPVSDVWLVALSEGSFAQALEKPTAYPYLDGTLVAQGTLLAHYSLTAHSELANEDALLSGQGSNAATEANCPTYEAVQPQTTSASSGLASGTGCVYPASVQTLAGQVTTAGLKWRAYAQDMSSTSAGTAGTCVHPMLGEVAPTPVPVAGQDYAAFRNPFVYFDSLLENGACVSNDVDLGQLGSDLGSPARTPSFSWIIPAACDDGSPSSCNTAGAPANPAAVDSFLREVVAKITATAAYQSHGLIIITFDSAPAAAPSGQGVGALLLSPFVHRGARVNTRFDDFTLLKSIEQLYGVPLLGHAAEPGVAKLGGNVYTTRALR